MLLDTLPLELLHRIFEYLPPDDLWRNLRAVNRSLNHEIGSANFWLKRANHRFDLQLPTRLNPPQDDQPTGNDNEPNAENERARLMPIYRCIATERVANRCSNEYNSHLPLTEFDAHIGTIDAIKLFKSNGGMLHCLSGGRDSQIRMWNMRSAAEGGHQSDYWINTTVQKAHDGWIWSISSKAGGEIFYSAGWDKKVKQWCVAEAEILPIQQIEMQAAALCCLNEGENLLFVSTYRNGPILFDLRVGLQQPQAVQNCHGQRPVFNLATGEDANQIFSIGDDYQLNAVDKRNFQQVIASYRADTTISHLDYSEGQLCVGLRDGRLLFFDPGNLQIETVRIAIDRFGWQQIVGPSEYPLEQGSDILFIQRQPNTHFLSRPRPRQMKSIYLSNIEQGVIVNRMDVLDDHIIAAMPGGNITFWPGKVC